MMQKLVSIPGFEGTIDKSFVHTRLKHDDCKERIVVEQLKTPEPQAKCS